MIIHSRPEEQAIGSGAFTLKMDFVEIQYIASLLYVTRLGHSTYKQAAHKLMDTLEELFDEDFLEDAARDVNLHVSRLADDGDTILELLKGTDIALEVS